MGMFAADEPSEKPPSHESVPSPLSQQEKSGVWARAAPASAAMKKAVMTPVHNFLFILKTSV